MDNDELRASMSGGGGTTSPHCLSPGLVSALRGMVVETFAFGDTAASALVHTCVEGASPSLGPTKGTSRLALSGYGFWPSDRIVVRFTPRSGLSPSRSCSGRFDPQVCY